MLLLLLLTGMETDLALVKRARRTAEITSAAGIVIPFACGYVLGEMLPENVLPDPNRRLLTSLFLATAMSISSVKIVAAVLREVDFSAALHRGVRNAPSDTLLERILVPTTGRVTRGLERRWRSSFRIAHDGRLSRVARTPFHAPDCALPF